jgi:hypothetical protein
VLEERHEADGTRLVARVEPALAAALDDFTAPVAGV